MTLNAFSVDLEEWFHLLDIPALSPEKWDRYESRLAASTEVILEALRQWKVKATFFILGWVGERQPQLVRTICAEGHEVASHGYAHLLAYRMGPAAFEKDLIRSLDVLGSIVGRSVEGYRAPGFSITTETPWAWDLLAKHGVRYDSSVFPATRNHGGLPGAPFRPYLIETPYGPLAEFPITTIGWGRCRFAFCGGGYLRVTPLWMILRGIRWLNGKGQPVVLYLHPRDVDSLQPHLPLPAHRYAMSYIGLKGAQRKVRALLAHLSFSSVSSVLRACGLLR